jgi:feruloyl esterase
MLGCAVAVIAAVALPHQGNAAGDQLREGACVALNGLTIGLARIGLPSGNSKVESAVMIPSAPPGNNPRGQPAPAMPAYCRVLGSVAPVDPTAPPIKLQINLPAAWNGKAVQYGGGAFNGVLITGLAPLKDVPPGVPTPLAQGYVTLGTDSGHDAKALPEPQAFALNQEAFINFAYASYKKVHNVTVEVVKAAFGRNPDHFYYFGNSEGGREALMMAQRFPEDYDGIISVVPAISAAGILADHAHLGLLQQKGGWLSRERVMTLQKAVLTACDGLDGLNDGIVGNIQACRTNFDPTAFRCADGLNSGSGCFSDAEIAVIKAMHAPYDFGFVLANGKTSFPGWGYGGEMQPGGMIDLLTGRKPPEFPALSGTEQSQGWLFGNAAVRYFFARDAKFDHSKFSLQAFASRVREVSDLIDATNPDLSAFRRRGGKLIMRTNLADYMVGPFATMEYYEAITNLMGKDAVDQFVRYYLSPGSAHDGTTLSGIDGTPVPSQVDLLKVLDSWVDRGEMPSERLAQTLHAKEPPFAVVASRPLCSYPTYPHYIGTGDPKRADSYECRNP